MKLNQLRDVVAIAKYGSLRAAARKLALAQPALTRSVRELEHELGAAIFERRTKGMVVTPAGEALVRRANAILADVQRAREEVTQIQGGASGSLVAGLSIVAHIALLPQSLRRFQERYPDVQLRIIEGLFPTLEAELKNGTIDFYIGPLPREPLAEAFVIEKLFDNWRTVICRADHPLIRGKSAGESAMLKDLAHADWITTSITHLAPDELGAVFKRYNLPPPKLVAQTQSALSLIIALVYTDVLAMLPVQFTQFALAKDVLTSIPLKETLPGPPMVLIRRAGLSLTPAAEFFVDLLRKYRPANVRPME